MIDKNKRKADAKKHRVYFDMNLGTRSHKSKKEYNRKEGKNIQKNLDKYL